jgi:hypothetical protein
MLTGMLAVRNLVLGQRNELWNVNTDQDYHEEVQASESYDLNDIVERALTQVFLRIDRLALGLSLGMASGLLLFLVTLFMVLQGGTAGPNLGLLGQFFPGYRVTPWGSRSVWATGSSRASPWAGHSPSSATPRSSST